MEQMEDPPALFLDPPGSAGRITAPDIETIGMVRTAILSGGVVLAASLIAVASAATLHIGPFKHKDGAPASSVSIRLDSLSARTPVPSTSDMPTYPAMLIAQDPGDEAWQRMLASASGAPHNLPISVTTIDAVKPIGAVPGLAYRTIDAPPNWAKLAGIRDIGAWGPFAIIPDGPPTSLFNKGAEPHEMAGSAAIPTPAASTPSPSASAPYNAPTVTPDPLPLAPPLIFQAPTPPPPPPPADTGSGDPPATPTPPVTPVPEPASWTSFIIGFGLIGLVRRRAAARGPRHKA